MRHINTHSALCIALGCMMVPVGSFAQNTPLETLAQCKPGTSITVKAVQAQLTALGLNKDKDGFYFAPDKQKIAFMDGEILAASVFTADGETNLSVYLNKQTGQQLAKQLRVTSIDEYANTDAPSYVKQTSKKTMLLVSSAAELDTGSITLPFESAITCKVLP
jgi:hypothetical protein